jgi:hypothetical protein
MQQGEGQQLQSPGGALRSSQASASHADAADTATYPVDEIKEPTPCSLHVPAVGTMFKVATGMAWPCTKGQVLHNRPLPKGYARVSVDNVVRGSRNMKLDIPGEDGKATLRESLSSFIAWRKAYIKFKDDDDEVDSPHRPDPPSPLSSPKRHPSPPPPARSPAHQRNETLRLHRQEALLGKAVGKYWHRK